MDPRPLAELARNRGLISWRAALRCGLSPEDVQRLVRSGTWVVVRRGVYAEAEEWSGLDDYVERPKRRARAALMMMAKPHALSHDSAALELGMSILRSAPELVHVTRDRTVIGSRTRHGVKHHGAPFHPRQVVTVGGLEVLDRARTAADIAREHGLEHGVAACDSALRLGTTRLELWEAVRHMRCWRGVRAARTALDLADAGAENAGESLARLLVIELGIGEVETQFEIRDHTGWVRCDLRVGRHVFEFDGKVKYQRVQDGGVAVSNVEDVVWREKRRQDWVCGYGLGMSRLVWADLWGERRRETKQRLLREYAATEQRWGSSLDDLRHLVVAKPERRSA